MMNLLDLPGDVPYLVDNKTKEIKIEKEFFLNDIDKCFNYFVATNNFTIAGVEMFF